LVYIQLIVKRKMVVMAEDLGHNYARHPMMMMMAMM